MNQREFFEKSGEIQYYLQEAQNQLEEAVNILGDAIWYCRESTSIDDGDRNYNLSREAFNILEEVRQIHNYWQSIYDEDNE